MFGIFRYLLALTVMYSHVLPLRGDQVNWAGWYAVWAFFVLSGFLMTRVLHRTYGYTTNGVSRFLLNRALRIYPPYWIAALLALLILTIYPTDQPYGLFFIPSTPRSWLSNVLIFGMPYESVALIPPAGSLHMELVYYVVMALGASRNWLLTFGWLSASVVGTIALLTREVPPLYVVASTSMTSLPFALDAALHYLPRPTSRWVLGIIPLWFAENLWMGDWFGTPMREGMYPSLLLSTACVWALSGQKASAQVAHWDRILGELSYPFFLVHMPIAYAVLTAVPWLQSHSGFALASVWIVAHAAAVVIHRATGTWLERWRSQVRSAA